MADDTPAQQDSERYMRGWVSENGDGSFGADIMDADDQVQRSIRALKGESIEDAQAQVDSLMHSDYRHLPRGKWEDRPRGIWVRQYRPLPSQADNSTAK